jgi:hypothetical protein
MQFKSVHAIKYDVYYFKYMQKYGVILLLGCILTACQQPTIYVYTQDLSQDRLQQLDNALSAQTLPYLYTQLPVPSAFSAATIILSSKQILSQKTEHLASLLQDLGYLPHVSYTSLENHYYDNGNIGLYIKNPNADVKFTMPSALFTTGCLDDRFNGMAANFFEKHVVFKLPNGADVQLDWEYIYNYLVIYYRNTSQSYTHLTPLVATPFGEKPSDTFNFNAQIDNPKILNCSLQIVYMD